ncbi:MAG: hypothetical protein GYA23_04530 [Methanomicrobiales archaeon]|nr:hypothetical protein [Methanomicrobiales archaeon]
MSGRLSGEEGYMSATIAVIVGLILLTLILFSLVIYPSYFSGQEAYSSMKVQTDKLALSGTATGLADLTTVPNNDFQHPAPTGYTGMNAVRLNLKLATLRLNWQPGTGDDLSQATVVVTTPQGSETIPRQYTGPPFSRPGWSIVSRKGMLPGIDANKNDLLEPNEVFSILVITSENLPPQTPFAITLSIPNVQPLTIERVVPATIRPEMSLV